MPFKKIVSSLLLLPLILFVSCGEAAPSGQKNVLETNEYSMQIPATWAEVDDTSIKTTLPEGTFRAAKATLALEGIYSKVTISKETLLLEMSSLKYADANITKAPLITSSYTKLDERDIDIAGEKTKLHIFNAKTSNDAPMLLFLQAYVVKDQHAGYTISFSTVPSEKNYDKYIALFKTFTLKK